MTINFLIVSALLVQVAEASPVETCDFENLEYAVEATRAGRLAQARRMLFEATDICGETLEYRTAMAALNLRDNDFPVAYRDYAALADEFPERSDFVSGAGRAAMMAGNTDTALEWLLRATSMPESDWRAWNALAVMLDQRRLWEESALAYEQASTRAPSEKSIWNNWGYSLLLQRQAEEALVYFERALAIDPGDEQIVRNHELTRAMLGYYPSQRRPGETAAHWAARLNNAGYGAMLAGNRTAARSLFARSQEASEVHYSRAAENQERLENE